MEGSGVKVNMEIVGYWFELVLRSLGIGTVVLGALV